jgi:leucyl aminopeptidase
MIDRRLIPADFDPVPSQAPESLATVSVVTAWSPEPDALAVPVRSNGAVNELLGMDRETLARAGFRGAAGQTLVLPRATGPVLVAVGLGDPENISMTEVRDAAAAFARATQAHPSVGVDLSGDHGLPDAEIAQAVVEGVLLARYRFTELKPTATDVPLAALHLFTTAAQVDGVTAGATRGQTTSRATALARDLANNPPGHLTATRMADVAVTIGARHGVEVETFDKAQLIEMGCGGLLGVNAGSAEEPRMIVMTYTPEGPATSHVALVGKGIMYDAGGISLKPSDAMHLLMKMDMAGAGAVLAAMTALKDLGVKTKVTGYLMCTDNMPSGTAMGLGDVLTIRGGRTVEIKNTDAEGRLVMADALVLATELGVDAIIDIATLTGSSLQTLGTRVAAVFGNHQGMVDQAVAAAELTDEPIWQLPLEHRYRPQLDSSYADMSNMGGPFNVAITAALFLNEFVAGIPWAHLDIAGTMQSERDDSWRSAGATGFGTRLLLEMLADFTPVSR